MLKSPWEYGHLAFKHPWLKIQDGLQQQTPSSYYNLETCQNVSQSLNQPPLQCHEPGTPKLTVITINVPVVFMARYVMVLRSATLLRGALEGVGPKNRDFFGP